MDDKGGKGEKKEGSEEPKGRARGGKARAKKLSPERRTDIAKKAGISRWAKERALTAKVNEAPPTGLPEAKYRGVLRVLDAEIPVYVLKDGNRIIGRTSATEVLTGIKGGGALEKYLGVNALKPFIDLNLVLEGMVPFRLPEVEGLEKDVKGLTTSAWIDICRGFVAALEASDRPDYEGSKLTDRQREMAVKASMFLAACAKVGLDALVDEATGYQYERASDALEVKLRAYLSDEMRVWEKTFPDELWVQFGRLTNWSGSVTKRPRYWGKLVMDLIYDYLDADVANYLRENAPTPQKGQNYHQWLSNQYGLKKLIEHIWKVIGIANTCQNMQELKQQLARIHGRVPVQYTLYLPATSGGGTPPDPRARPERDPD